MTACWMNRRKRARILSVPLHVATPAAVSDSFCLSSSSLRPTTPIPFINPRWNRRQQRFRFSFPKPALDLQRMTYPGECRPFSLPSQTIPRHVPYGLEELKAPLGLKLRQRHGSSLPRNSRFHIDRDLVTAREDVRWDACVVCTAKDHAGDLPGPGGVNGVAAAVPAATPSNNRYHYPGWRSRALAPGAVPGRWSRPAGNYPEAATRGPQH